MHSKIGFTLAELLVAMVILGLIATFTLPKVLSGQADTKKKAVFRETIAALKKVMSYGLGSGEMNEDNSGTYFITHLNPVKICDTNAISQGCWGSGDNPAGQASVPGVLLHNGACVVGLDDSGTGSGADTMAMDWNCQDGPNVEGTDILRLRAFFNNVSSSDRVGTIRTESPGSASHDLWEEIFRD